MVKIENSQVTSKICQMIPPWSPTDTTSTIIVPIVMAPRLNKHAKVASILTRGLLAQAEKKTEAASAVTRNGLHTC